MNHKMLLQSAPRSALRIARGLLSNAQKKARKLKDGDDSLHELRISLRRLRAHLKAYQFYLRSAKPEFKKLSKLAKQTNEERDTAVHRNWLSEQLEQAGPTEPAHLGFSLLLAQCPVPSQSVIKESKLSRTLAKLDKALRMKPEVSTDSLSFAEVSAGITEQYMLQIKAQLGTIENMDDTTLHRLRLNVKKLRYLLEELGLPEADGLAKSLKQWQDALGQLQDLHTLEPRILPALQTAAQSWATELFAAVEQGSMLEPSEVQALVATQRLLREQKAQLFDAFMALAHEAVFQDLQGLVNMLKSLTRSGS